MAEVGPSSTHKVEPRGYLHPRGPLAETITLLCGQPHLRERSHLGPALPRCPGPSPTRSSHPIQWGFLPLLTLDQGKSSDCTLCPPPRKTHSWGSWSCRTGLDELRAGLGALEGSRRPQPSLL